MNTKKKEESALAQAQGSWISEGASPSKQPKIGSKREAPMVQQVYQYFDQTFHVYNFDTSFMMKSLEDSINKLLDEKPWIYDAVQLDQEISDLVKVENELNQLDFNLKAWSRL